MMRYFLFFLCLCNVLFATEEVSWEDWYCQGIVHSLEKKYETAILDYTNAIRMCEQQNLKSVDSLYIERANIYSLLNEYECALQDVDYAIYSGKLSSSDLVEALEIKIFCLVRLERFEEVSPHVLQLRELDPRALKITNSEEYVIVKNPPKCECSRKFLKLYFLQTGIVSSEEKIVDFPGNLWALQNESTCFRRKCKCHEKEDIELQMDVSERRVAECEKWCNRVFSAGQIWCNALKTRGCVIACLLVCESLKEGCYWCCGTGDIYSKCVKPFEDIASHLSEQCLASDWN